MTEKHIILEDIDTVTFYGVGNAHLQMLRSLYPKLRVVARDNVIRILGDEEQMAAFEETAEKIRQHVVRFNALKEEDILEQDDFTVRVFNYDLDSYHVKHTVTHNANGITYEISEIPASLIEELRTNIGDGITIEFHSYCKKDVWDELQHRSVKTGKACNVNGQIHTALQPDKEVPIFVEK